jgi:predicted DNA-binding transcriptional regulator YafY
MAQTQDTTISYPFTSTVTMQIPRTVYTLTDPQTVDHAIRCYYIRAHDAMQQNGDIFPFATLHLVAEAMADGGAVTVLYTNEKGETTARTIFPHSITLTSDRHITCFGYCTYRRECRSFRLDAMKCVQLVTTPAEAAPVAA